MSLPVLTLVIICSLGVTDLLFRSVHISPPLWMGDTTSLSLVLLGFGVLRKHAAARQSVSLQVAAAKSEWEKCLPCLFHEIRNYSCTLRSNALLLRRQIPDGDILEPLGRLERTAEKIESLSREMLSAALTPTITRTKSLDVRNLIQDCVEDHFSESRDMIRIHLDGNPPTLEGDRLKLERVFLNLIRNSMEAGANNVSVRLTAVSNRLRILIEDNGQGCTGEQIARIFHPLYTTKKERGGSGLGLYLVKAIVEAHGGSVRAISKNLWGGRDSGMIFCIEFPRQKSRSAWFFAGNFRPGHELQQAG